MIEKQIANVVKIVDLLILKVDIVDLLILLMKMRKIINDYD